MHSVCEQSLLFSNVGKLQMTTGCFSGSRVVCKFGGQISNEAVVMALSGQNCQFSVEIWNFDDEICTMV